MNFKVIQEDGVIKFVLNFEDGQIILSPSDKDSEFWLSMMIVSDNGSVSLHREDTHELFAKMSLMFKRLESMYNPKSDGAVNDNGLFGKTE